MPIGAKNLTKGPIFSQLAGLALPIMATSFVQMAYSLTDMAWVGRLGNESAAGSESVAAVGSVGILIWLTSSFAILSKIAAEVSIGQSIGAGKTREAMAYASHTTTISLITALIVTTILFFGANFILSFFKLPLHISGEATTYMRIVSTAVPFSFLIWNFSGIYNGCGRSHIPFMLTSSGLICNMLLDPLFIFGMGNFEGMGVKGAAIATWLSQAFVLCLFIWQLRKKDGILNRFPFLVRLRAAFSGRIFLLGFPVAIMNFLFASINMYIARIASISGGHIGVTTQTTGGQIEGITWSTSQGLSTALGAFVAQNYAAGKMKRAFQAYRYILVVMLALGILVSCAFFFLGQNIFGILIPEAAAMNAGRDYLKIMAVSQIFMMLELTTQGMFNGMGKTLPPAIVSIVFNFARIPMALALSAQMGVTGVWWAITISSVIKGIVLPIWLVRTLKKRRTT